MNIDAVNIVTVASAALSALGALSIIASFVMFPTMRQKQGRQLLFALSIADLATALGCTWRRGCRRSVLKRRASVLTIDACVYTREQTQRP